MKNISALCSALFLGAICSVAVAQGIYNNGAFIVMTGPAQIYVDGGTNGDYLSTGIGVITPSATDVITLEGDWTNNAVNTGFTGDAGTVVLNDAAQTINGTSSTTFYNLTLLGTGSKTLNVATSVGGVVTTTGILSLGTRPLILNSNMLTITNPVAGAITYSTGYIQSETNVGANPSIIRWQMGITTGAHVYPFGTVGGIQIPLTFNKTPATGATIDIATRPTVASDNLPWSTGVTQMYDPTLLQDGSDEAVIDRWWDITSTAAITADVTFSYRGVENTMIVPYNTGNVGSQYWTAAWMPNNANIGSTPVVGAGVGAHTATGLAITTAFTPWVLSSVSAPLPIELIEFSSSCDDPNVILSWSTASEQNNNYFTLQRSDDGIAFRDIGTVQGGNNSSQVLYYSFIDSEPTTGTTYYRLKQTDYNGQSTTFNTIVQEQCGNGGETIGVYGNGSDITVTIFTPQESNYVVTIYDVQGKLITTQSVVTEVGTNRTVLTQILPAVGVYMVNVTGASGIQYSSKVHLLR